LRSSRWVIMRLFTEFIVAPVAHRSKAQIGTVTAFRRPVESGYRGSRTFRAESNGFSLQRSSNPSIANASAAPFPGRRKPLNSVATLDKAVTLSTKSTPPLLAILTSDW
jgi:hypothetical protein